MTRFFNRRAVLLDYIPAVCFLAAIITLSVVTGQMFIKTLPCVVSVIVMILSTNANRYSFLIGAANCFIYAAGYIMEGLYGSAAQAAFVSAPFQIATFILWTKHKDRQTTRMRRMTGRVRLLTLAVTLAGYAAAYFAFSALRGASDMMPLDAAVFVLGLVVTVAQMLAYVDSMAINTVTCLINVSIWIVLTKRDVKSVTYLLISVYNLYRCVLGFFNYLAIYKRQQREIAAAADARDEPADQNGQKENHRKQEVPMKKIGRAVHWLKTAPGNPRNGEGAFIRLTDGRILYAYTRFCDGDKWEDHSRADLAAIESADEGETWSASRTILTPQKDEVNLMCVSLLRMKSGEIGLFYGVKYTEGNAIKMRIMMRRSADEGITWSEARLCADEHSYLVLENDRVVRLTSGRLVIPLNRHGSGENFRIAPGAACFYYSDDDGMTWQAAETQLNCPTPSPAGLQETGLFEHADGRLTAFSRTDLGCQYVAHSRDGGLTWTDPVPAPVFASPCSPMCMKSLHGHTVAILNPDPHAVDRTAAPTWGRTPLVLMKSDDDFATAPETFYLEDDADNGYCYTAVFEGPDYFLAAYYHSDGGVCPLASAKILKVAYDEFD